MNLEKINEIFAVDDMVRYVGIIDSKGNVIDHKMKKSMLDNDDEETYRMDVMIMRQMLEMFDQSQGRIITIQTIREKANQLVYYRDYLTIYVTCEPYANKKKMAEISDKIDPLI